MLFIIIKKTQYFFAVLVVQMPSISAVYSDENVSLNLSFKCFD